MHHMSILLFHWNLNTISINWLASIMLLQPMSTMRSLTPYFFSHCLLPFTDLPPWLVGSMMLVSCSQHRWHCCHYDMRRHLLNPHVRIKSLTSLHWCCFWANSRHDHRGCPLLKHSLLQDATHKFEGQHTDRPRFYLSHQLAPLKDDLDILALDGKVPV